MRTIRIAIFLIFVATAFNSFVAGQSTSGIPDWQNPQVFARNQEPHHIPFVPFTSVSTAIKDDWNASPFYRSLNGTWNFKWFTNPGEVPENIHTTNASSWFDNTIEVPSCWQMEGYGHPKFRNVHQPFPATPPKVPEDYNPVGVYKKSFIIPEQWDNHQIFLHFEGVKSASYVWINGEKVGYDQGGMEPAEYDITKYLQEGENTITVQVFRYCDGTYLECQDMWRLSGIYRDVYLMATPKTHIRDFYVTTDLDSRYRNATLNIQTSIINYREASTGNCRLSVQLYDEAQNAVLDEPLTKEGFSLAAGKDQTLEFSEEIKNPKKWSAEYPNLYTLTLKLEDGEGELLEVVSDRVGFREVEIKDRAIYVNGRQIKFNGVNSHMHHPVTGREMDLETMRKDLTIMKQFNINCVRTSHYPPNHEYLDLADELGLYVVDETNDEAHATIYLSENPEWRPMYLDRVRGMVKRDRNHPSVVIWSAGNESGSGENIAKLIELGKKLDPTRPGWLYGGNEEQLPFEDIIGPRYPHPDKLKKLAEETAEEGPRPSFMDEYLAASGNSLGELREYWEIIRNYDRTTGGAIWDWVSPGIKRPVRLTPDASPNGNQGVLMGNARLVSGKFGKALALSGNDEWVEFYRDPVLDITGKELTIETWIYPRKWNGYGYLINKGNHQYGLKQTAEDTLQFYIHDGKPVSCAARVPDNWKNNWHHIAGIYNGEQLQLYIDGKRVAASSHSGSIDHTPYPVNIGRNAEINGMEHPGQLNNSLFDNVAIYNRALTPFELKGKPEYRKDEALLWCEFESVEQKGSFYSLGIGARPYGLVWPDRQIQPEMWQLKKVPQPVKIEAEDLSKGKVRITNRHHFKNLSELSMHWTVKALDSPVESGTMQVSIAPGKDKLVTLPVSDLDISADKDHWLTISFRLPEKTQWAEEGHEIAWEQFQLPSNIYYDGLQTGQPAKRPLEIHEHRNKIIIKGSDFQYTFNKEKGLLTSVHYKGKELIKTPPRFNVWRAPIWNQEDTWGGNPMGPEWRKFGLNRLQTEVKQVELNKTDNMLTIQVESMAEAVNAATRFGVDYTYEFTGEGKITIKQEIVPASDMPEWLPKIGTQMVLQDEFDMFSWYGRGPFETYPDRKAGAKVGLYKKPVEELYVPYLDPQEHGNHTDVRWAALTSKEGLGLYVSGDALLNVSASHFSTDNLTRAQFPFQLKDQNGITLNVDHKVSGVGGTPVKTLEKYRVMPENYQYTIRLLPFDQDEKEAKELYRE